MKITKILNGVGICLILCLTIFLSAFKQADYEDLARIIVKSLTSYEKLKEMTPKTKETMDSWLPNRGSRSKYAILKPVAGIEILESVTGIKVFREGPHQGKINYYSNNIGYYNPEFLNEVNRTLKTLFEDPEFKEDAKALYESQFQSMLKTYYAAYKNLHHKLVFSNHKLGQLKEDYLEKMANNNLPEFFLSEHFRRISDQMHNQGYDWSESNVAMGFWLRRSIDGTDTQFLDLLKMVFENLETKIENDTLNVKELEVRDGLQYQLGLDEPFTGVAINNNPKGVKIYESNYVKGKRKEYMVWNRYGKKVEEVRFEDGIAYKMTWDYMGNLKVEMDHILKGNQWEMISQTNYNQEGKKQLHMVYKNDQRLSETYWYPDGNKKEEKNYGKESVVRKVWDHNGNELILGDLGEITSADTVDLKEIEWKGHTFYKKGSNKPFTGIMTFTGELDYRKGISWRVAPRTSFSTATLLFGKFRGPYIIWYEKNGSKKSQRNLKNETRGEIEPYGSYTKWYRNGQKEYEGNEYGAQTQWYENGQIRSKKYISYNGRKQGVETRWHENGQKLSDKLYFNDRLLRVKEWDPNGIEINEGQTVIDEDKHKIKSFANEFISILKSKNYEHLEKLIVPTKIFLEAIRMQEGELSEEEIRSASIKWDERKLKRLGELKKMHFDPDVKIEFITYNFKIEKDDGSRETIKWPNSINYVMDPNTLRVAHVEIFLYHNESLNVMQMPQIELLSWDNQWYLLPN